MFSSAGYSWCVTDMGQVYSDSVHLSHSEVRICVFVSHHYLEWKHLNSCSGKAEKRGKPAFILLMEGKVRIQPSQLRRNESTEVI